MTHRNCIFKFYPDRRGSRVKSGLVHGDSIAKLSPSERQQTQPVRRQLDPDRRQPDSDRCQLDPVRRQPDSDRCQLDPVRRQPDSDRRQPDPVRRGNQACHTGNSLMGDLSIITLLILYHASKSSSYTIYE